MPKLSAMVIPTIIVSEKRQNIRRRHRWSHVSDWHIPCNAPCRLCGVSLVSLYIWLLHRVISYDPHIHCQKDESLSVPTLPKIPPPLVPPDMMDPAFGSSTSRPWYYPSPLMLTWQSNQHAHNQDRAIFYPTFPTQQSVADPSRSDDAHTSFLVGLFDGHGRDGHLMAEFVTKNFAAVLATKLNALPCCQSDDWIAQQLNDTFYEMEEQAVLLSLVDPSNDFAFTGGCTASVTMRLGQRLFFANAGDSRTMLVSHFAHTWIQHDPYTVNVTYSTRLDKADLPEERGRIQGLGGRIYIPPLDSPKPSRVVLYSQHLQDQVALAMSRSLGDHEWTAIGVTPEPIVDVIQLDRVESAVAQPYLIVASDGLWDCRARRPQFFAKQIGAILFQNDLSYKQASEKLRDLIQQVTPQNKNWYRDDITVIAFRL